ncbi:peptidoglycan editing factor PgeF [Maribius pontilimi]|uniref:Purine nucleoside phosphorylase n=1 Tax=Palleronia pontilimi TaxID=1964209 RepID=A0A934MCE6_9RHOB|nr:peptidoglycan editing factor PgeF [Palleronia pontilimi]MBJ3761176.1 peptidoglycan editing factor PgeF [Palleronia pontilimi]
MTLEILTTDTLSPFRHGFFTRRGGASSGVFSGLNCGYGSSDQHDIVRINRARAAGALDVTEDDLNGVHQVHSADVVVVDGHHDDGHRADALVTGQRGQALSVLTADCMPVLFADPKSGIVGAAHAGWRGALSGVLEATLDAMESLGAARRDIRAVIGPCISQGSYEVGPELMDEVTIDDPQAARFFAQGDGDRLQFDLPGYGLHRLRQSGVGEAEWTRHCTYSDADRFYSYRRSVHRQEADYGRLIAAIRA